jgi:hypothetical protein
MRWSGRRMKTGKKLMKHGFPDALASNDWDRDILHHLC